MASRRHSEPTQQQCDQALEIFDHFCSAGTQKMILGLHRELCNCLNLKPNPLLDFYPQLKSYFAKSWKAQALFKYFDQRANHKVYANGRACPNNRVFIIGAGPCGLRTAIECQLLGAKVVIVEKRDRMSRNNVLHLWPFVIEDLKAIGAKQFYGKFCAGDINHISIRQLQCILLKVALLLGVEFHESVSFEELLEPTVTANSEVLGWRARVTPKDHPVSQYEFDCLIGADGKRNTLQNFKRTEFRGKLALAITVNFINRRTKREAAVPEISGVSSIYKPDLFRDMHRATGINLENIVYYKDDTHYFVMTAKKPSLLSQGVLKKDYADVAKLLCIKNVDNDKLIDYAKRAADFATQGKLPTLDFALNHYGDPDVALFDFTSIFFAENASSILERKGHRLLCQLVGDSLLEPFWPTGSGCARGFLSSFDASWAIRSFAKTPSPHPLDIIEERESIFRLLGQTTSENLNRDLSSYTLDPCTRYPNWNRTLIHFSRRISSLYDSDDPQPRDAIITGRKRKRAPEPEINDEALIAWVGYSEPGLEEAASADSLAKVLRRYRPDLLPTTESSKLVYAILEQEFGIQKFSATSSTRKVPTGKLRQYLRLVYNKFKGEVPHIDHQTNFFNQIKQNQQKEKSLQNIGNQQPSAFTSAAEAHKKKRRSSKSQVSNDPAEFLRKKIGKLEINDITKLARLIEGHDAMQNNNEHNIKQKELQEQIIALLDPEDSPDPNMFRESVSHLLQGTTKTKLKPKEISEKSITRFFQDTATEKKPSKPPRKLKGLDGESIKVPDFSDIFDNSADVDTTVIKAEPELNSKIETTTNVKKKQFVRSASTDSLLPPTNRRLSEVVVVHKEKSSESPEIQIHKVRSNSIGAVEIEHNTRRIAQIFEGNKRTHTPSPESRFVRSGSISNPEIVLRLQRMEEILENKRVSSPSPDRSRRSESIGNPEMALRRQKVAELIEGYKPHINLSPELIPLRRNSGEISFRVQRVSDMMQKRNEKRPKTSRRKAAREIMKQRFEKSVQMLATEPRFDFATTDLENDYGLQQYRASALQFGERVKKLEKKLQHHGEARAVGSETRATKRGHRIIELAANLSGPSPVINLAPPSKPKDLLRAVGRLERDDWNVKEIEKRILKNRLGRPEPGTAERVPKWDRKEFLDRQKRLKEGSSDDRWKQTDETLNRLDRKRRDSGRPELGTNKVANLAKTFAAKDLDVRNKLTPCKENVTPRRIWERPATPGMTCASCSKSVFAAEAVIADGIHLHRSCFRCSVCKTTLRPGNYTTERNGVRLVCLRHGDVTVPDTAVSATALSDAGATVVASTSVTAVADVDPTAVADVDDTAVPDVAAIAVADVDPTAVADVDNTAVPDVAAIAVADVDPTAVADVDDTAVPDVAAIAVSSPILKTHSISKPPERISLRLSSTSNKIDEDEWTDRNFLQSETSCAGGLTDISESCSDDDEEDEDEEDGDYDDAEENDNGPVAIRQKYTNEDSDDSYGDDDASDDAAESSENESGSRMREAREARRREVPTIQLPPPDSSEVESDEESESSEEEVSSATEVSTDSEFAREEIAVQPSPPAILVTEPIPPPPPPRPQDYPLNRTRSAGGLATKRALELKRRYLLGEPSPPAVRKSDSTSQLDTKIEAVRTNITEFQKMLHPAPIAAAQNVTIAFHVNVEKPPEELKSDRTLDSDSLSEDSHTQKMPNQTVPIVEVHNEGGELIEHNSTLINISTYNADEKVSGDLSGTTVVVAESESSESCDATTLALTETELSDWAAESVVLDDCGLEDKEDPLSVLRRSKNPRTLSGPKIVHDAKNVTALSSHVCGRTSPEKVMFSNALEYFEFADEGDQDPSIEKSEHPVNEGFMEIVHEFDHDSPKTEPKNVIESFAEMIVKPNLNATINRPGDSLTTYINKKQVVNGTNYTGSFNSDMSPPLEHSKFEDFIDTPKRTNHNKTNNNDEMISPPLTDENYHAPSETTPSTFRVYSPAICRSKSENFHHLNTSHSTLPHTENLFAYTPPLTSEFSCTVNSNANDIFLSPSKIVKSSETSSTGSTATSNNLSILSPRVYSMPSNNEKSSGSLPSPQQYKVLEINKDRQKQMEVVRGLVLERLGNGSRLNRRCSKRPRMAVVSNVPPPVPPLPAFTFQMTPPQTPPSLDTCLPPPRPAPPIMPLPVMPSLSDPELTKEKRNKSFLNSITKYLNRRFRPRDKWPSESDLFQQLQINRPLERMDHQHKSTGALEELALSGTRLSSLSPPPSPVPETGQTIRKPASIITIPDDEDEDNSLPRRCYVTFRRPNKNCYIEETQHTIQDASVIILTDSEEEEIQGVAESSSNPSCTKGARPKDVPAIPGIPSCSRMETREARARKEAASQQHLKDTSQEPPRAAVRRNLFKKTAEGQAELVADYVQRRARREAHEALKEAEKNRKKPPHPK